MDNLVDPMAMQVRQVLSYCWHCNSDVPSNITDVYPNGMLAAVIIPHLYLDGELCCSSGTKVLFVVQEPD